MLSLFETHSPNLRNQQIHFLKKQQKKPQHFSKTFTIIIILFLYIFNQLNQLNINEIWERGLIYITKASLRLI